ncbi:MAG: YoaK family protein [Clostridiales bacterium]|nr:YoaK family protein [Clostridiales bacterium]
MKHTYQVKPNHILHWNMSFVGGFIGVFAIMLHAGHFGSAQTGNVLEIASSLAQKNYEELWPRLLAIPIYGGGISLSYILTNCTRLNMKKLVLWIDAAALIITALLPSTLNPIIGLYPFFFCSAIQWGTYTEISGYNSASIFVTNNIKQAVLGWTQYFLKKERESWNKAFLYSITCLAFFLGAFIGGCCVCLFGSYGAGLGLIPLITARVLLSFGDFWHKSKELAPAAENK